jgi:hypothetical protein
VAVNELLGPFFGLVIVVAVKLYAVLYVAVATNDVSPISIHGAARRLSTLSRRYRFVGGTALSIFVKLNYDTCGFNLGHRGLNAESTLLPVGMDHDEKVSGRFGP